METQEDICGVSGYTGRNSAPPLGDNLCYSHVASDVCTWHNFCFIFPGMLFHSRGNDLLCDHGLDCGVELT